MTHNSFVFILTYFWLKVVLDATSPRPSSVSMSSRSFSRPSPKKDWERVRGGRGGEEREEEEREKREGRRGRGGGEGGEVSEGEGGEEREGREAR